MSVEVVSMRNSEVKKGGARGKLSNKEFMPSVFVDIEDAVNHEYGPQGQTINHSFCSQV
jgi:hypothetical protein